MFGNSIKAKRKIMELSVREVSRRSDVSHTYLINLENGKDLRSGNTIYPSFDVVRSLCDVLDINYVGALVELGYLTIEDIDLFMGGAR